MDAALIQQTAAVLGGARRGKDVRPELLALADELGKLLKDLRDPTAWVITDVYGVNDAEVAGAFARHRKDVQAPEQLLQRINNLIDALADSNNPLSQDATIWDLVAELKAALQGNGSAIRAAAPASLAELALLYARAKVDKEARQALARWLYGRRGRQVPAAAAFIAKPVWLKEKLDAVLGDARPADKPRPRPMALLRQLGAELVGEATSLRPAFMFAMIGLVVTVILFLVSMVLARPPRSLAAAETTPPAAAPAEESVFALFAKQLDARKSDLKGAKITLRPRQRDNGDARLAESFTSAGIEGLTVVPWVQSREVLGSDTPDYDPAWLKVDQQASLLGAESSPPVKGADTPPKDAGGRHLYYADLQRIGPDRGRISLIRLQANPEVVIVVSGRADGLAAAPSVDAYLQRAKRLFPTDPSSPAVALALHQAWAAAATDAERAQAELELGLVLLARSQRSEAEAAFKRAWPGLTEQDRQRIPIPVRLKLETELRTPEQRLREQLELPPTKPGG
jgi:hypothetical protein